MKRILLLSLALAGATTAFSQNTMYLKFLFHNDNQEFALDETIEAYNGVNYSVQGLAFYLSRVALIHDGGQVTELDTNTVFYVNHNAPEVNLGQYDVTTLEGIRFDVGVPEYLNHLDISQYPEGHALSYQTPTMHWGWSAGYMHLVMNGKGDNNGDGTPTVAYELHCLGDENVHTVYVTTTATAYPWDMQQIVLICNLDQWLRGSNPATSGAHHGHTGLNASTMSNVNIYPVFVSPETATVTEIAPLEILVAQSGKDVTLSWKETPVSAYTLVNAEGKLVSRGTCAKEELQLKGLESGLHIVQLFADNGVMVGTTKWIVP